MSDDSTAVKPEDIEKTKAEQDDGIVEPYDINKSTSAILAPPPEDRPHSSWRAVIYTKSRPKKVFVGHKTFPRELEPHEEHMEEEFLKEEVIPAKLVQLSSHDQYVKVDDEIYAVTGLEIHSSDGTDDKALKREWTDKHYIVSLTFRSDPTTDPSTVQKVNQLV